MNYQIVKYGGVILSMALRDLKTRVRHAAREGWRPKGGVAIQQDKADGRYVVAQAMTREETAI